ncbi:MAG: acyltransferase [Rhodobacteraceae bacterium]|nr:acyltransferase [Paracoccaceae bacterium]
MSHRGPVAYRPEIDGLRTLAVLPVLIYHLKVPFFGGYLLPGGFLGVDVFFVISGFLITQILLAERDATGRISLWRFYQRRARRILPALVLVILASSVAAWAIMLPSELLRFANSALAALGFVSNGFWYLQLGEYGAQSAQLQPLLHTWSLAIEEQFYLLFPLLLMVLPGGRPRALFWALVALCCVGLAVAQASTMARPELSFFSPVSRAWELLAGAVLAVAARHRPARVAGGRLVPALSVAVLALCMTTVHLPDVVHPGLVTVPAVLATAGLLWFTRQGEPVTDALCRRPMVYIGRLSYSLYLWHFPIFAFGRLVRLETPGPADWAVWLALTFGCAALGYHLIERPFRAGLSGRTVAVALGASVAVIVALALTVRGSDLLLRDPPSDLAALYGANQIDNAALRDQSWQVLDRLAPDEKITATRAARGPSQSEAGRLWFTGADTRKVLIVGNSHSKDLFNALYLNADAFQGVEFARFGLATAYPEDQRALLFAAPNFMAADVVMIAQRYTGDYATLLPGFVAELRARGKRVILVGNTAEFTAPGTLPLFDWFIHQYRSIPTPERLNVLAHGAQAAEAQRRNDRLRELAGGLNLSYLSRRALVCDDAAGRCDLVTPAGRKTMYDDTHWTLEGAAHFGAQAARAGWLAELMRDG